MNVNKEPNNTSDTTHDRVALLLGIAAILVITVPIMFMMFGVVDKTVTEVGTVDEFNESQYTSLDDENVNHRTTISAINSTDNTARSTSMMFPGGLGPMVSFSTEYVEYEGVVYEEEYSRMYLGIPNSTW